jgi:predicted cupin superfamily sugar epimerase
MHEEEALRLVAQLNLRAHPEGGYFGETFRSRIDVEAPWGTRPALTSIYYVLSAANFSAFHRLRSDEIWHHYRGAAVAIEVIETDGRHRQVVIGGASAWQAAIGAGSWFAAHVCDANAYALVGCDVAPGFAFEDFELGTRGGLTTAFSQHRALIERWTRT